MQFVSYMNEEEVTSTKVLLNDEEMQQQSCKEAFYKIEQSLTMMKKLILGAQVKYCSYQIAIELKSNAIHSYSNTAQTLVKS